MKRVKESGAFFKKKKKAREEELKKNEGAILKFVKIASTKDTAEVSSHNKSLLQVETEEEVYLEQNNNKVIIEKSKPINEILLYKEKTDDIYYSHNDVATWPEVLTHNMRVEIIKLGPYSSGSQTFCVRGTLCYLSKFRGTLGPECRSLLLLH